MTILLACALLPLLFPRVSSLGIQFINPQTHGTDGGLSNPPTYKQDYTINIQWYSGDETGPYDLVLHQVKTLGQDQTGDGEFIMRKFIMRRKDTPFRGFTYRRKLTCGPSEYCEYNKLYVAC